MSEGTVQLAGAPLTAPSPPTPPVGPGAPPGAERPPVQGFINNTGRILDDFLINMRAFPQLTFCLGITALMLIGAYLIVRDVMAVRHDEFVQLIERCTPAFR
jgi:hypothetical protein